MAASCSSCRRFFARTQRPAGEGDIIAGFALTGHFLERDVLAPHGLAMPQARERLIGLLARQSKIPA